MQGVDSRMSSAFQAGMMTDELAIEMWRGDEIAQKIVSMLPKEAMEPGIKIAIGEEETTATGATDTRKAADLIAGVESAHRFLQTEAKIVRACEWERLFGGAALWIGANDFRARDWSEPLDLEAPMMRVQWLDVIRSRDLYPHEMYTDPQHPKYGQVAVWRLSRVVGAGTISQQALIHESRLHLFRGRRIVEDGTVMTQNLASTEFGDGIMLAIQGELRRFAEALDNTELSMRANGELIWQHEKLSEILANDGRDEFRDLVAAMQLAQSILRARVVGANQTLTRQSVSLSGLAELVDKYENRIAGIAGVPRTKLFGEAPGGLGNNGSGPQEDWDETKRVYRKYSQIPAFEWVTKLVMRSLGGEPKKWSVEGRPYRQPSETEKTGTAKLEADIDIALHAAGLVTQEEVRARSIWRERFALPDPNAETMPEVDLSEIPDDIRMLATGAEGAEAEPAQESQPQPDQAAAQPDQTKVADLAFNGAQVTALAAIVEKVAAGVLPADDSTAEMISVAFRVTIEQARRMMPPSSFRSSQLQPARMDAKERTMDSLIRRLAPSGKCAECGKKGALEVDHVHGRGWDPAALSHQQRLDKYWSEYDAGKKLRALCRECNARDGAANKQGKSGPAHRGDAIIVDDRRRFTFVPLPEKVVAEMRSLQERVVPASGATQELDHVTIVFCPKAQDPIPEETVQRVVGALRAAAAEHDPFQAKVQGWAYFDGAEKDGEPVTALVALVDAPGITELHVALRNVLMNEGMDPSTKHSFTPHFTFGYLPAGERVVDLPMLPRLEFSIDRVCFANAEVHEILLGRRADCENPVRQEGGLFNGCESGGGSGTSPTAQAPKKATVRPIPRVAKDKHLKVVADMQSRRAKVTEAWKKHGPAAAVALADVRALTGDDDGPDIYEDDLLSDMGDFTGEPLDRAESSLSLPDMPEDPGEFSLDPDDREEGESPEAARGRQQEAHAKLVSEYQAEMQEYQKARADLPARAEAARSALQSLYDEQSAAVKDLETLARQERKARKASEREIEEAEDRGLVDPREFSSFDENEGEPTDPAERDAYYAALDEERKQFDDDDRDPSVDVDLDALKSARSSTAAAIKELNRYLAKKGRR